ncbi:transposase [Streptomyces sp. NPDC048420]|uniref:transposase n=1 Tax=Streptomyces sp. NPDC048420 TaxID=3155755 RepID=UPI00342D51AC
MTSYGQRSPQRGRSHRSRSRVLLPTSIALRSVKQRLTKVLPEPENPVLRHQGPEHRTFATKGEVARRLALRALASDLPIGRMTADSAYGQEWGLHRMLDEVGVGHVLGVPKSQRKGAKKRHGRLAPLTVAEARRLLATCRTRPTPRQHLRVHALSWSGWRRRRQAVARAQRRTVNPAAPAGAVKRCWEY